MKILFDCQLPFAHVHGGFQTQVEESKRGLEECGIEVEYLRWWDDAQQGDLIHFWGVPSLEYLRRVKGKKIPIVLTHLLTGTCNRPDWLIKFQGGIIRSMLAMPGWGLIRDQLAWRPMRECGRIIVGLEAERYVLETAFGVRSEDIRVVPLGLSDEFLNAPPAKRDGDYLVTTGTITARKRSVELAKMAHAAGAPILFVGKPYSTEDPYWHEFKALIDGHSVRYQPHTQSTRELIATLGGARGFVIYSMFENWCLSAHEAAACGLPLLVQDQKWSKERFGEQASYLLNENQPRNADILSEFYHSCPAKPKPDIQLHSWKQVGDQIARIYKELI